MPATRSPAPPRWRASEEGFCTICRQTTVRPAYLVDGYHIVRCACCGHLYVSPRPKMDEVVEIYGESYFENPAFKNIDHEAYFGYMDYLRDRHNIQLRLRQVLQRIERHEWRGRLLDIGCGLGLFVEVAAMNGWDAWGVDLNRHAVEWAQAHVSPNVRYGTVASIEAADSSFDCVTMFDVIEHLADPREELQEVWRVLRPGGLLVIVTPDAGSLVSRVLGNHWLEMKRAPEHLQFFTMTGLARLLDLAGFTAFEWHSIGKITTIRTMLADLRFYFDRLFSDAERALDRMGLADKVVDVDPRTKLCMYARKTGEPRPLHWDGPLADLEVHRVARRGLGRSGVRRVDAAPQVAAPDTAPTVEQVRFRNRQRKYWEHKDRFLDPRKSGPQAFAEPKLDWAARHVTLDQDTSVLDVGAGNGTVTWYLAQRVKSVVGIDFSRNLLARSPCENPMVQGDAARLPFRDRQFDVVLESNFLHHVADPVRVLQEMKRVGRRNIVLIEPNRWHLPMTAFMTLKRSEWRGMRFDRDFVTDLATAAGLRLLASEAQGAVYPNQSPAFLLPALARFDRPGALGAYVVTTLEIPQD